MLAGCDHFQCLLRADDARQALCATGTGQQAEIDFGQPAFGGGHRDAVVASERHFEAAAECRTVNGGDDGLGGILDHGECIKEARTRRGLAEFGDVGTGDEGAAFADQHDGFHSVIGERLTDAAVDGDADAGRQGVDGR